MGHVLIVEDNRDIGTLYQRALFSHEHTLKKSAEAAVEILQTQTFDLIILDMHLPEKSGLTVLEYVRHQIKDDQTPIFAISADDLLRPKCEEYGIQAWMTKPVELDVLMDTAAKLIEEYSKTRR